MFSLPRYWGGRNIGFLGPGVVGRRWLDARVLDDAIADTQIRHSDSDAVFERDIDKVGPILMVSDDFMSEAHDAIGGVHLAIFRDVSEHWVINKVNDVRCFREQVVLRGSH